MIEVVVESIRVNMANYKRVVMLKEKDSTRYLPIWIGHFEADAIAIPMQKVPVSRPLTHDLLRAAIGALYRAAYDRYEPAVLALIPPFPDEEAQRRHERNWASSRHLAETIGAASNSGVKPSVTVCVPRDRARTWFR